MTIMYLKNVVPSIIHIYSLFFNQLTVNYQSSSICEMDTARDSGDFVGLQLSIPIII